MIYNKNGNALTSAYNVSGDSLESVYDLNGNAVYQRVLKVMTYNVQWFQNFNSQQTMQELIINSNDADIIGIQEISKNGTIPSLGQTVLSGYGYKQLSSHKNYMALASKKQFSNYSTADFQNQDAYDASEYNETRAYQKCTINVGGIPIVWINAHLCFHDASVKAAQMMELLTIAEQNDYCIITGDFNSYCLAVSDTDYVSMYKPFVDAGYNLANCTEEKGFTKTWTDSAVATSTAEMTYATDNIITSANINIMSVKYDSTKFSYLDGHAIDHIPVIAELQVN